MYFYPCQKNNFFSTKTLWLQLIDNNLVVDLNNYVEYLISNKYEEKNNIKEIEDKEDKIYILEKNGLSKKIPNYRKLNKIQKKDLIVG